MRPSLCTNPKALPTVFLYCSQCQSIWSGLCARQGINNVSTCHMVACFLTYSLYRSLAHSRNHSHLLTNPAQPTTYPPAHAFIRSPTHAFSSTHPPTNSATHLRPSILYDCSSTTSTQYQKHLNASFTALYFVWSAVSAV